MSDESFRARLIDLFDTTEEEVRYWQAKGMLSKPQTKSTEVVRVLYEFMRGAPLKTLPSVIKLDRGVQLVQSRKGDCYYYVNSKIRLCSCPEFKLGHSCEHLKAMMPQSGEAKESGQVASEMPKGSDKVAGVV